MRINSLKLFNRRRDRQTTEFLSNEDYSWIWEPFKDAKDSKLAQTACLAAEIIANSSPDKIIKVQYKLPPRIVIPLCAIALQKDLNLDNINQLNIQEFNYREDVVDYFLEITKPSPRWRYLFNSLSPELQYKLCYRLSNYRLPTKNDWRNLFKNNSYQFNRSLDYAFILTILLTICSLAIIGMYGFVKLDLNSSLNILVFWSFITIVSFWFSWGKHGFNFKSLEYIKLYKDFINSIGILAFIVFISGILVEMSILDDKIMIIMSVSAIIFQLLAYCNKDAFKSIFYIVMIVMYSVLFTIIVFLLFDMFDNQSIVSFVSISAFYLSTIIWNILGIENNCNEELLENIGLIMRGITGFILGLYIGLIITLIIASIIVSIIELIIGRYMYYSEDNVFLTLGIFGMIGAYIGMFIGLWIRWDMGRLMSLIRQVLKLFFISTLVLYSFLSTVYFVNYALINIDFLSLGWRQTLLFWLTTLGISATLYWRGKTLDYEARNPLKGILDNTIMQ